MKTTVKLTILATAALLMLALSACTRQARAEGHRAINPPGTETGLPFSNGIQTGNTLYVAGMQGTVHDKLVAGGIGPETAAALDNIRSVVEADGLQMKDVVAVNVYLADIHDFPAMNNVYKTYFPDPKPTRTTVQAAALVNNARIEISAVAVRP